MMTEPEEGLSPSLADDLLGSADAAAAAAAGPAPDPEPARPLIKLTAPPPWERANAPSRRDLVLAGTGFGTFVLLDLIVMFGPLMGRETPTTVPQTVILIVFAFGLGGLLAWQVRGPWRLYGIGLMLGWIFLTLISAGFATGVMP